MHHHLEDKLPANKGKYLGEIYADAVQRIGDNEELKAEVSEVLQRLESGEKEITKLWQETKQWSMQQYYQIYDDLNIEFDEWFFESEEEQAADRIIKKIVKSGKVPEIKISEGAIIADLEKYDLGVLVLIKSDGTKAYGAKDISLTQKKFDKFKLNESIWVVDKRQKLYLKQIFKIMELIGYKQKMTHVDYDFVKLPSGTMASRKGNVIAYEDFRDSMLDRLIKETKERHKDWAEDMVNQVAQKVAMAALKFGMLKYENKTVVVFDMDEAMSVEGATGPYLLYTVARINSIIKRADQVNRVNQVDLGLLKEIEERDLIKHLSRFVEIVENCVKYHQPSYLCTYLLELAQKFNTFYHQHSVIRAKKDLQQARVVLLQSILHTMTKGLELLNIETVEEM
jgi:arginyl-tRNA synthetase